MYSSDVGAKQLYTELSAEGLQEKASLETLRYLAPEGITNFGIALAKHCNLVFCSFVLQIDQCCHSVVMKSTIFHDKKH